MVIIAIRWCLFYVLSFIFFSSTCFSQVILLGAMPEEIEAMKKFMLVHKDTSVSGFKVTEGEVNKIRVVLAQTGVGKVNAAIITSLLISKYHPSSILFTGVAGSLNETLKIGDVVIASATAQHDLGTLGDSLVSWGTINPRSGKRNPVFFPADSSLLNYARTAARNCKLTKIDSSNFRIPEIKEGIVVTGDVFLNSKKKKKELHQKFGADAVEMEGASVAQVAWEMGVPALILRSISDDANGNAHVDFKKFVQLASLNSANLVYGIVSILPQSISGTEAQYRKTELYFGQQKNGKKIDRRSWLSFVDTVITPKFPEGLTIIDSEGKWRDRKTLQIKNQKSKVLVLLYKADEKSEESIRKIIKSYCKQFDQQSVLRVDATPEKVTFD